MKKDRTVITQELCDHVKILLAGGATTLKAAEITKTGHATISRIKKAGFSAEVYKQNTIQQREKKTEPEEKTEPEQVPGQIRMDLTQAEEPKTEMSDQTKMMRFLAGRLDVIEKSQAVGVDVISMKLDKLNDTLSMILRAIRKE